MELEEVTFATGVPTVMQGLIDHYRATRTRPGTLKRVIGGARRPERIIEEFEDVLGVEVVHGRHHELLPHRHNERASADAGMAIARGTQHH